MKKFFSLTLTLAAMLSVMAVNAQAADYSFEPMAPRKTIPPLPMRTSTVPATITVGKMW